MQHPLPYSIKEFLRRFRTFLET